MENEKECPECKGKMILVPGWGGLFWRCQKCGVRLSYNRSQL